MCDYSLEMYASRPAREGEEYLTTRFASGSIGLTAPGDAACAICVQYDTPLALENLPAHLRESGDRAEVVFARLDGGAYHDAVAFADGRTLSLQQIGVGVVVRIKALLELKASVLPGTARPVRPALVE